MVCEAWKEKLDIYLDGELPAEELRTVEAHVRTCSSCTSDALARIQMRRAIHMSGKRFTPSAEFRKRVQRSIAPKPQRGIRLEWMLSGATALVLAVGILTAGYVSNRSRQSVLSEIADLHVASLASSSPVDVISTDRHTVKPWFQGRIPFAFDLPELQNSQFTLLGGRMTYLDQAPGAHLIYDVRRHHISVFIFQERAVKIPANFGESLFAPNNQPFNMETWNQGGLRFFVVGDASPGDVDALAKLFRATS
jgi:anti-sigma factor RsiW